MPSFSSSLFDSYSSLENNNSFEPLQNLNGTTPPLGTPPTSPFKPTESSTPNKPCKNASTKPPKQPARSSLTSICINFRSYLANKDHFINLLNSQSHPIDIIFGTETWLTSAVFNAELDLDEYDIHRRDREGKSGGGVVICVKKIFKSVLIEKSKVSEAIFVKINIPGKSPVILCSAYRAPDLSLDNNKLLCEEIFNVKNKFKKSIFWLSGDFNLPDIDWVSHSITTHQYSTTINQLYLDLASDLGLSQTVLEPTRGNNILDLFFTNNKDLIKKSEVISGVSDHEAVVIESRLFIKVKKPKKRVTRLWKKVDMTKLKSDAKNFSTLFKQTHSKKSDINSMWSCIKVNIHQLIDEHVPTKTTSTKVHQPWITTETKRLIRNKGKWYKKAKKRDDSKSWKKYKDYKKRVQRLSRKSHDDHVQNLISEDKSTKKLWNYIKSQRKEETGIADLTENNKHISNAKEKADLFNKQFSNVFSSPCDKEYPPADLSAEPNTLNSITVSKNGVLKLLLGINESKATGPDDIPGKLLKSCAHELHEVFTILFQKSLDLGEIPDDWKIAHIFPLFKKGDKCNVENYRPISLTSITCKLLEHIVHSNISSFFDSKNFLTPLQHGFRQKRSCESQLLTTLRDFSQSLNKKGQTDAILLDFSKAFDKVDHKLLLSKVNNAGIHGPLLSWLKSFLNQRLQHVVVDGCISDPNPVLSGVPQGTVLGPLLFLIYINDIADNLSPGSSLRLFADDSLLYREIKTSEDSAILQKDLDSLQAWEVINKMEFHPGKCQLLRLTNKRIPILKEYVIHNIPLKLFTQVKYLGVTIDSKLCWNDHTNALYNKASRMLGFLERNFYKCPSNVKEQVFNALVRPLLDYGCTAWDPYRGYQSDKLEMINKRAARFVTGNHIRTHGETSRNMRTLGWTPLSERRAKIKLVMLQRIKTNEIEITSDDLKLTDCPRFPMNYQRTQSSTVDSHLHSFFPSTIRLWNSVPTQIKSSTTVTGFKKSLDTITIRSSYEN